jgi:hypothetical protein
MEDNIKMVIWEIEPDDVDLSGSAYDLVGRVCDHRDGHLCLKKRQEIPLSSEHLLSGNAMHCVIVCKF